METIYFLDTEMPIPSKGSNINSFEDVYSKPVKDLDTSHTIPVVTWVEQEFDKILKNSGAHTKYDFSDISVAFFNSQYYNIPDAFFSPNKRLISIKIDPYYWCNCKASNVQLSTIHEFAHAVTSSSSQVGTAVTEGISLFFEKLYCKLYGIPYDDEKYDEGYMFSENLINVIIAKVYNYDLDTFFERIKKGNEESFIKDIDEYLKSQNIRYSANELLRMSSILFYAKKVTNKPFEIYHKSEEMEQLRKDILQSFLGSEKYGSSEKLDDYSDTIKYILDVYDKIYSKYKGDLTIFSNTFDRELGLAMVNNSDLPLEKDSVKAVYKKVADIINNDSRIDHTHKLSSYDEYSDNDGR